MTKKRKRSKQNVDDYAEDEPEIPLHPCPEFPQIVHYSHRSQITDKDAKQ